MPTRGSPGRGWYCRVAWDVLVLYEKSSGLSSRALHEVAREGACRGDGEMQTRGGEAKVGRGGEAERRRVGEDESESALYRTKVKPRCQVPR